MCLCGLLVCCVRPKSAELPASTLLQSEDFGAGVRLLGSAAQAEAAARDVDGVQVELLTREGLLARDPVAERVEGKDLIYLVEASQGSPLDGAAALCEPGELEEVRIYLDGPRSGAVTLGGRKAGALTPVEVEELFGKGQRSESGDGTTHLTYYFAVPERRDAAYKLVTSHDYTGACYQVLLGVTAPPPADS
jgi:hypothetical protein